MQERRPRSVRNLLSTLLFIAAGVLFAAVVYMYFEDRNNNDTPPPPNIAGRAELKNVYDALVASDFEVEYGRQGARIEGLSPAGQQLIVEDWPLFVFLFDSPEDREESVADIDLADLELADSFGDPVTTGELSTVQASNVFAVLDGGGSELAAEIEQALSALP